MRREQDHTVLDRLDACELAGFTTVAQDAEIPKRGADTTVVAPVGERLEQLSELVEVGAHLQARDTGLLIDDAEKTACLERELEEVANVLPLRRGVQLVDVLDAPLCRSDVSIVESFDCPSAMSCYERKVVFVRGAHQRDAPRGGDAPVRQRQTAEHCLPVVGIIDCGEQRQRILDLAFLKESRDPPATWYGTPTLAQRAHRGLHVDVLAEEPRYIRRSGAAGDEARTFTRDCHGLAAFVGRLPHLDGGARVRGRRRDASRCALQGSRPRSPLATR